MTFFYALLGDSLLFTAIAWFAGYGALGPAMGLRLTVAAKLRLFAEVFALTAVLLFIAISLDRFAGWAQQPPWPGSPPPHRIVALGIVLTAGFYLTRRRAKALALTPAGATQSADEAAP